MGPTLDNKQKDMVVEALVNLASSLQGGVKKEAGFSLNSEDKERMVSQMLNDPTGRGFKRVAYAMTEPLRTKLDYIGIGRKLIETDLLPQGVVPVYDKDFSEVPAVVVAFRGNPKTIEGVIDRIEVPTFEIATIRSIKYQEISIRRFNALDRTKNKAAFELKIAEDDEIFSAISTAATTNNKNTNVSSDISRSALAEAFADVEEKRLVVGNILTHPNVFKGIRKFSNSDLDQVNMQALLETGLFASIWGANIWVSDRLDQISNGTNLTYVLASPRQLGRFPIRYDVEIKPWDYPPGREVLFTVYENVGVSIYNTTGVAKVTLT
jgi:hypothetical protein